MKEKEIRKQIRAELDSMQDLEYKSFHLRLVPTMKADEVIGVRTPQIRAMAKRYSKDPQIEEFLKALPHATHEENQLHSFTICLMKDYDKAIQHVDAFLPYVNNWATCDQLNPKIFSKNKEKLEKEIDRWLLSSETYTIRFGIEMLMNHFLDDAFKKEHLQKVAAVKSKEYYVNMMIAWYFATALTKQWEETLPAIEGQVLDIWTHNKTIQKACESFRISKEKKEYLRTLKRK